MKKLGSMIEIKDILQDIDVFQMVLNQIKKDLSLSGFSHHQFEGLNPGELIEEMNAFINENFKTNPDKMRRLFYRVDLDENELIAVLKASKTDDELYDKLNQLLLFRQTEKVVNRSTNN